MRDDLDKEMQLNKQLEEKLFFDKLLKSEVERELAKTRSILAEVIKAKEALQQELSRDNSVMYETANKLRDRKDARQTLLEKTAYSVNGNSLRCRRSERLHRKKDGEVNSFIIEVLRRSA